MPSLFSNQRGRTQVSAGHSLAHSVLTRRDRFVTIVAGDTKPMETFLRPNPKCVARACSWGNASSSASDPRPMYPLRPIVEQLVTVVAQRNDVDGLLHPPDELRGHSQIHALAPWLVTMRDDMRATRLHRRLATHHATQAVSLLGFS